MRILIVSDAAPPQVNGVVRTLGELITRLTRLGHIVRLIGPTEFRTVPMPTYAEIPLALLPGRKLGQMIAELNPEAVHIATEGPLGLAARRYCLARGLPFTTAYHTRFPQYLKPRFGVPEAWTYAALRRFHAKAQRIMVATDSIERELREHGFRNIVRWGRGVDTERFQPRAKDFLPFPRPIFLHVGRVALEKNIEDFLSLDLPGTKLVVGEGPARKQLEARFPDARFVGYKENGELARYYAASDVFVLPSKTETFGLVLLEALASGLPVAAYPVAGPLDVIGNSGTGVLHENLRQAALDALAIDPARCRVRALQFSWDESVAQFLHNIQAIDPARAA